MTYAFQTQKQTREYEQMLAAKYYHRLKAIYAAKVMEFSTQGKRKSVAEAAAERYVISVYCDGHPCKIYAVAQARLQLVREGLIPTNASVVPKLWDYDPYTRLHPEYADQAITG